MTGLPRLLAAQDASGRAEGLTAHRARYGPLPRGTALLIDAVERAGLTGRGGAGFPTAIKMRGVASGYGPTVVVANGAEGEPASRKDRTLLATAPHLVLDGIALAAAAVGATQAVLCLHDGERELHARVEVAIAERAQTGEDRVPVLLYDVESRYVASEETALVQQLNGGPAVPSATPPRPSTSGVRGRPTLTQNVETLAHLALIAYYGDQWFRSIGTPDATGSRLLTLGGAVAYPGVYEVVQGTTVRAVLEAAGARTEELQAVLLGGYFGTWLPAGKLDVELTHTAVTAAGGALGAGVLYALDRRACGLAETARVIHYLAAESAGQCGPCQFGLPAVADDVGQLAWNGSGRKAREARSRLARRMPLVSGRGACRHPDGAVRFVETALRVFADEVSRHTHGERCIANGAPAVLPVPNGAGSRRRR